VNATQISSFKGTYGAIGDLHDAKDLPRGRALGQKLLPDAVIAQTLRLADSSTSFNSVMSGTLWATSAVNAPQIPACMRTDSPVCSG
jgi:hypothetical protein